MHGHIVIFTETVSVYIMIKSTLQFDDIGVVSMVFSRFLYWVQRSSMQSRKQTEKGLEDKATKNEVY